MNYTQSITRRHRTAFVLAIDQSGSMVEELEFRGRRTSKAAAVAEVANSLLSELLLRATREGEVRDYYDIAVVGYSGEGVHSLLSANETFVPVSALRNAVRNTRRVSIERRLPDGQPAFNEVTVRTGLGDAGDELRQRKPRFHIAADRIQNQQQSPNPRIFLNSDQLGNQVLVLGRLIVLGQDRMSLDAADDRKILQIALKISTSGKQTQFLEQFRRILASLSVFQRPVLFFFLVHILPLLFVN